MDRLFLLNHREEIPNFPQLLLQAYKEQYDQSLDSQVHSPQTPVQPRRRWRCGAASPGTSRDRSGCGAPGCHVRGPDGPRARVPRGDGIAAGALWGVARRLCHRLLAWGARAERLQGAYEVPVGRKACSTRSYQSHHCPGFQSTMLVGKLR